MLLASATTDRGPTEFPWTAFVMQLPLLLVCFAILVAVTIALTRARPEDIPKIVSALVSAVSRSAVKMSRRQPLGSAPSSEPAERPNPEEVRP